MNPSTVTAIIIGIMAGVTLTQLDLDGVADFCTPRIAGAMQWQEETVATREGLADTQEEIERAAVSRKQWDERKSIGQERLASFQNLKKLNP